jgi:hypothetical protein
MSKRTLAAAAAIALLACGGKTDEGAGASPAPPASPVAEADYVDRVVAAVCDNLPACCAGSGYSFDHAGCERTVREELDAGPVPNATWDESAAGSCVQALATIAAACDENAANTEPCSATYRGTLPEGSVCMHEDQCLDPGSGAWCVFDEGSATGTCVALKPVVRGQLGDACNGTCASTRCGILPSISPGPWVSCYLSDGLTCNFLSGVCSTLPKVGEPCPSAYCASGGFCQPGEAAPVCASLLADGASCLIGEQCRTGYCDSGVCSPGGLASPELCSGS